MEWLRSELLKIKNKHIYQRRFHPRTAHRRPEVVKSFGSSTPHSQGVLLHTYFPPDKPDRLPPVILVPGANKDAHFFLDPDEDGSNRSLPEFLRRSGRQVYALTFAHNQDDNWWCCAAINRAIEELTEWHPDQRFDLLGHSKGGVSVRLAATDWRPEPSCTRYLGHRIRRLVLVGAPNSGVDYFFRYPAMNAALYSDNPDPILNWPMTWSSIRKDEVWHEVTELGYSGPYYPGQGQMLAPFPQYPLPQKDAAEEFTYHGGEGEFGRALGLEKLMIDCRSLIPELKTRAPGVGVCLIGGSSPSIPKVVNDLTGPGDGIVYLASALHMPTQAKVVTIEALPYHHKALIAEPSAQEAILRGLSNQGLLSLQERHEQMQRALSEGEKLRWEFLAR